MKVRCLLLLAALGSLNSAMAAERLPPLFHDGVRTSAGENLSTDPEVRAKKPVLIYYANDVRTRYTKGFDRNILALVGALESYKTDDIPAHTFLTNLANRIPSDIDNFNSAVDQERDALFEGLASERFQYPIGLAVFRSYGNPVTIDDKGWELRIPWEFCTAENAGRGMTRKTFKLMVNREFMSHPFWAAQPLSSPYTLLSALEAVQREFPEDSHRYILVVKSRGDRNHFLLPWLEADITHVDASAIAEQILAHRSELANEDGIEIRDGLAIYGTLNDILRKLDPEPAPLGELSFRKEDFLESLARLGGGDPRRGMFFTCLLCDTVDAELDLSESPKLRRLTQAGDCRALNLQNVGQFYSRQGIIAPQPLPYDKLFFQFGPRADDFHDQFEVWLTKFTKESQR